MGWTSPFCNLATPLSGQKAASAKLGNVNIFSLLIAVVGFASFALLHAVAVRVAGVNLRSLLINRRLYVSFVSLRPDLHTTTKPLNRWPVTVERIAFFLLLLGVCSLFMSFDVLGEIKLKFLSDLGVSGNQVVILSFLIGVVLLVYLTGTPFTDAPFDTSEDVLPFNGDAVALPRYRGVTALQEGEYLPMHTNLLVAELAIPTIEDRELFRRRRLLASQMQEIISATPSNPEERMIRLSQASPTPFDDI